MTQQLVPIATDLAFGESPRWHDGRVWFCDWIDGDVRSVDPDGSNPKIHAHLDGFPICIDWDRDGHLLVVDGSRKRLLRGIAGELEVHAELSSLSDRPWNEIVTHRSGGIYLNGIGYDLMTGEDPAPGHIALLDPDGSLRIVAEGLAFPNGMGISADGTTLVVAESHAERITSFTIETSGDLVDRRPFAKIEGSAPDGVCVAADDTVWYADVPNRHCQRVADGGEIIETVEADRGCFSCAVSPEGELFITATGWNEDTFTDRGGVLLRSPITKES